MFDRKIWKRTCNHYHLDGTSIDIYFWNSGKNQNYMLTAGYRNSNHIEKTIPGKGPEAREIAIKMALELRYQYLYTPSEY